VAFFLGSSAPNAGLCGLQGIGQAHDGDDAAPADRSRSADLEERRVFGRDGEEELGILVPALVLGDFR